MVAIGWCNLLYLICYICCNILFYFLSVTHYLGLSRVVIRMTVSINTDTLYCWVSTCENYITLLLLVGDFSCISTFMYCFYVYLKISFNLESVFLSFLHFLTVSLLVLNKKFCLKWNKRNPNTNRCYNKDSQSETK